MNSLRNQRWRFLLAALGVAMGVYLTLAPPPGTPTEPSAASRATEQALARKLSELNWSETPLNAALNEIERGCGVSIKYDLDELRADGLNPAKLVVTARLRDIRARKALEMTLADASPPGRLCHFIDHDGTVVVTTERGDAKRAVTRRYDISDFLHGHSPKERTALANEIIELITQTVDPESWVDAGGAAGAISFENDELIIRQTPERLRLLDGLMKQLRQTRDPQRLLLLLEEDRP